MERDTKLFGFNWEWTTNANVDGVRVGWLMDLGWGKDDKLRVFKGLKWVLQMAIQDFAFLSV